MKITKSPLRVVAAILLGTVVVLGLHWFFTGYMTFTQTRWDDHYSFEYPASFRKTVDNRIGVRFVGHLSDGSEVVIKVGISDPDSPTRGIEGTLSVEWRELLERTTVTLLGVPCEIVIYKETHGKAHFVKRAFFEYVDRLWDFSVYAEPDHREEVEALFQHVFDTFEVLP
jgi:hypothetical protein